MQTVPIAAAKVIHESMRFIRVIIGLLETVLAKGVRMLQLYCSQKVAQVFIIFHTYIWSGLY